MEWDDYYDDEIYAHCRKTKEHEHINAERCGDCSYSSCDYYPQKIKKRYEDLERLRSNEFSQKILESACKLFSLTEDEAQEHLVSLFSNMQSVIDTQVKTLIKDSIAAQSIRYIDGKISTMLDDLFKQAIEDEILVIQKDEKALTTTIRQKAWDKIVKFVSTFSNDRNRQENHIDGAIARIVNEKVEEALKEIKQETIEKFSKEAMKKMMQGMAKAISDDKKLLSMMIDD